MSGNGVNAWQHSQDFPLEIRGEALKSAMDIRKFEIELYWSRASYFWAIIAAAFAGFFALGDRADTSDGFIVACVGLAVSWTWYLVNRGSAFWQRNWESHVDLLEDDVIGPLHKSIINRDSHKMIDPIAPYRFSPSRLNVILSIFICSVWGLIALRVVYRIIKAEGGLSVVFAMTGLTLAVLIGVPYFAGYLNTNKDRILKIRKRKVDVG